MRCAKCRELISRSFDEDLGERERGQLVEHLAACPDCLQHHAVLEEGRALFAEGLVDAPENFEWKVQLGIQRALREGVADAEESRFGWAFWGPTAASATAVAALVLVAGSFLMRSDSSSTAVREFDLSPMLTEATAGATDAAPDLSGARAVEGFEVDAFRDGYGIRTVSDHLDFSGVREMYPMAGRSVVPHGRAATLDELYRSFPSQVLHLRLVNTKLRAMGSTSGGSERALPVSTTLADSAASAAAPRR